ncbi:MAG: hypothetical protein IBGAMO2_30002 [Arenicellales bacterium IbO2]|nr:MAG: hypothetical protein IBGAMO2_30002 [Arenicellales bacterium IbO2]
MGSEMCIRDSHNARRLARDYQSDSGPHPLRQFSPAKCFAGERVQGTGEFANAEFVGPQSPRIVGECVCGFAEFENAEFERKRTRGPP